MKMKGIISHTIILLVLMLLPIANIYPCHCSRGTQIRNFNESKAVFVGTVVEIVRSNDEEFPYILIIQVAKQWKGKKKSQIEVLYTGDLLGICPALGISIGQQYLVYGFSKDKKLYTWSICSPTINARYAKDEINNLNRQWFHFRAKLFSLLKL
jgi:hypothetical protein